MEVSEVPRPRIVGTEMEYSVSDPGHRITPLSIIKHSPVDMVHQFARNGARIYMDIGLQLEYSTPECASFADAVYADFAGERIIQILMYRHNNAGKVNTSVILKRVIDYKNTTSGFHENYLIDRSAFLSEHLVRILGSHLISRAMYASAGMWSPTESDPSRVVPAQKLQTVKQFVDISTTANKPLINTRDEPHTTYTKWARLHVITGDATLTPWASWMKLGTTSLVIRLAELGYGKNIPGFTHAVEAARRAANDTEGTQKYHMDDCSMLSNIDIQEKLLEAAEHMSESVTLPPEEMAVLSEWRTFIDQVRKAPEEALNQTEWHVRRKYMQAAGNRNHMDINKLIAADKAWDFIGPNGGAALWGLRDKRPFPGYDASKIHSFVQTPPTNTRAHARGAQISRMAGCQVENATVNWSWVNTAEGYYSLQDPYATEATFKPTKATISS